MDLQKIDLEYEGVHSLYTIYHKLKQKRFPGNLERHVANIIADVDQLAVHGFHRFRYHPNYPLSYVTLFAIAEQLPNPNSRVMLGQEHDHFGQLRVVLDWRLEEFAISSIRKTVDILAMEVGAAGLGRIRDLDTLLNEQLNDPRPMNHHMGTTRMNDDPKKGVVDKDCRVHGVNNLFIAGSSIFPTTGNANPTFTIIALAIRLCDHLKDIA